MSAVTFLATMARRRRLHDTIWIASAVVAAGAVAWAGVGRGLGSRGGALATVAVLLTFGVVAWGRRRAA